MARPISTLVHGILDYVTAPTLIALPRLLKMPETETNILTYAGLGVLAYSIVTRYELGIFKLLPMKGHLALDITSGAGLMVAPFIFSKHPESQPGALAAFLGFGAFEIAAGLLTKTEPSPAANESVVDNVKNLVSSNA